MKQLDPIQLDLDGVQLIEASAGTGKTYTIASLYLRLLLEPRAATPPLSPEQILVVTFTRPATAELRDRIRRRILAASRAFRLGDAGGDAVIAALLMRCQGEEGLALKRLEAAERSMDEAAIFTIHGFCQRMLKYNAFESGEAFDIELMEDDTALKEQAAADFWRLAVYPQEAELVAYLIRVLKSPDALLQQLSSLLNQKQIQVSPPPFNEPDVQDSVRLACEAVEAATGQFKQLIARDSAQIVDELLDLGVQKASVTRHVKALCAWAQAPSAQGDSGDKWSVPEAVVKAHKYLVVDQLKKLAEKAVEPPACLLAFDAAFSAWQSGVTGCPWLLSTAFAWICRHIEREKARLGQISPDDLLSDLGRALAHPELGERLAAKIRHSYPVAMIDEFQDTDPLQYQIFSRIYRHQADKALLMIGDPKQAIYGFRGADIFTYMQAKSAVEDPQRHTLIKNFRSTRSMVTGVNALFEHAEAPFIFARQIGFDSVDSQHQDPADGLVWQGQLQPALSFWHVAQQDIKKADLYDRLNAQTAERISELLTAAQTGQANLDSRALQPRDIAVLVRSRRQAETIRTALAQRNIRSAFLSRENVLGTAVAAELLQVLLAIREPRNGRYLTAALAGSLVSWPADQLQQLRDDESQWQRHQQQFQQFHDLWLDKGIMAALRSWMVAYAVPRTLLCNAETGERTLTDLQHLVELVQEKSRELQGAQALLHWYIDATGSARPENEREQLRLESDQDLIQIVTIHRSKGLEYPVVFLPFAATYYAAKEPLYHERVVGDDELPAAHYDFHFAEQALTLSEEERLAEDLRLLYVALTRAKCLCYVGVSEPSERLADSALGYLFKHNRLRPAEPSMAESGASNADDEVEPAAVVDALRGAVGEQAIGLELIDRVAQTAFSPRQTASTTPLRALNFSGHINDSWRTTSYSGLVRNHAELSARPGVEDEPNEAAPVLPEEQDAELSVKDRFSFPKGAKAGDFLHHVLEQQRFADNEPGELAALVASSLAGSAYPEPALWAPVVTHWLEEVLATPLRVGAAQPFAVTGLRLGALGMQQLLPEMEFHLPIGRLNCHELNQLLQRFPVVQARTGALRFNELQGMLKGFIDLVFEYDGRYYVADYKSNHLGRNPEGYRTDPHLDAAMAEHRYDVQLVLYTLALHRFLRLHLGDAYRYEQHIGGGFYLFIRGMFPADPEDADTDVSNVSDMNNGPSGADNGVFYHRPEQELIEALDCMLAGLRVDWESDEPVPAEYDGSAL